jgi:hypothetical protein
LIPVRINGHTRLRSQASPEPTMAKILPHLVTFLVVVAAIKLAPRLPG